MRLARFLVTGMVFTAVAGVGVSAAANPTLEERVELLERRVAELEARLATLTSSQVSTPASPDRGWRSIQKGMTKEQVAELVGEPDSVTSLGGMDFWYYGANRRGQVVFSGKGKVKSWVQPASPE